MMNSFDKYAPILVIMLDFHSLKVVVNTTYSFVGIEKQGTELCLCLPKGFNHNNPDLNTFIAKRDIFFILYRIIGTFKDICLAKGYLKETSALGTQDRDGVINSDHGSEVQADKDSLENIFYSKLDIIDRLLNAYDEPKIIALANRLGKSNKFDISKIYQYLHQAVYLPNHAAYVDEMLLPRRVVRFESTDIVTMYCYIFCEIKQQLKEVVNSEILALAERFRQHYLESQDSIFEEQCYKQVLDVLKEALETIDHNTPMKDADYYQYYEVIELFLYGNWHQTENGKIWGINNFHAIWESICLTYLIKTIQPSLLLHLDTKYVNPQLVKKFNLSNKLVDFSSALQINGINLMPDAIIFNQNSFEIIDVKYYPSDYFYNKKNIENVKNRSVRKQFVYEYLIQKKLKSRKNQYSNYNIRSTFWLPNYRHNNSELLQEGVTFMDGYIQIKNVNFMLLAESYLD